MCVLEAVSHLRHPAPSLTRDHRGNLCRAWGHVLLARQPLPAVCPGDWVSARWVQEPLTIRLLSPTGGRGPLSWPHLSRALPASMASCSCLPFLLQTSLTSIYVSLVLFYQMIRKHHLRRLTASPDQSIHAPQMQHALCARCSWCGGRGS